MRETPQVGDVWEQVATTLVIYAIEPGNVVDGRKCVTCQWGTIDADNYLHLGSGCCWIAERVLKESGRLVSRSAAPSKERDWSAWLPPRALPLSGFKEFKVGRVYATAYTDHTGLVRAVFRCIEDVPANGWSDGSVERLASSDGRAGKEWQFATSSIVAQHAVLVADVGCEPTDPAILYGAPPPVVEGKREATTCGLPCSKGAPCINERGHRPFDTCDGVTGAPKVAKRSDMQCNTGRAMGVENGPGLVSKSLPPARQPYVCAVSDEDCLGVDV